MKISLLILILAFTKVAFSQVPVEDLTTALKSEHFSNLKTKLTEIRKSKSFYFMKTLSREIINDYNEIVYEAYDTITWNTYTIKLIIKRDKIILYHFSVPKIKVDNNQRIQFIQVIDSFRNTSELSKLKLDFKNRYETDLSEDDLWQFRVVGVQCGMVITPDIQLKDYIQMESFVTFQKRDSLLLWLKSANMEKQMFGLWGFSKLKQTGYSLTATELKFIKIAMTRKGHGNICGGCDLRSVTIKEFAKDFNFE